MQEVFCCAGIWRTGRCVGGRFALWRVLRMGAAGRSNPRSMPGIRVETAVRRRGAGLRNPLSSRAEGLADGERGGIRWSVEAIQLEGHSHGARMEPADASASIPLLQVQLTGALPGIETVGDDDAGDHAGQACTTWIATLKRPDAVQRLSDHGCSTVLPVGEGDKTAHGISVADGRDAQQVGSRRDRDTHSEDLTDESWIQAIACNAGAEDRNGYPVEGPLSGCSIGRSGHYGVSFTLDRSGWISCCMSDRPMNRPVPSASCRYSKAIHNADRRGLS